MIRTPEQLEAEIVGILLRAGADPEARLQVGLAKGEVLARFLGSWVATIQQDAFSAGRLDVLDGENVRAVLEKTRQDAVDEAGREPPTDPKVLIAWYRNDVAFHRLVDSLASERLDTVRREDRAEIERLRAELEAKNAGAEERTQILFKAKNGWADRARAAEAKNANLVEALDPLLRVLALVDHLPNPTDDDAPLRDYLPGIWPTIGDLRRLRAAAKASEEPEASYRAESAKALAEFDRLHREEMARRDHRLAMEAKGYRYNWATDEYDPPDTEGKP